MGKNDNELSQNELNILNYIRKQVKEVGYPPSVRELCKAVGLRISNLLNEKNMTLYRLEQNSGILPPALAYFLL